MIRRAAEAAVRVLAFQYPSSDLGLLGSWKCVWAGREEIESGKDEEAEGHSNGIIGGILRWKESEEATPPVGDVFLYV